jgi:ribosomal protein L35AE/L33A
MFVSTCIVVFFVEIFLKEVRFLHLMKARVAHFRQNRHTQYPNRPILLVDGVDTKEKAKELVGKKVIWVSPGKQKKEITGKVTGVHGSKGAVHALMEKGLPGQILGTDIELS